MADEIEGVGGGGGNIDSLGRSFALSGASREKADRLVDAHTELIAMQKAQMREEEPYNLSHLKFRRFSDHAKSALEIAVGLVILLVVCGLCAMVWNAAHDRDLVVEAFSVPPDMAGTGLTGTVLAARVLDRFGEMQEETFSIVQGAGSYRGDTVEPVRVEIPETGISIGEIDHYLRMWLGSETHVTGDVVRTSRGLALTVRYGAQPGATFAGTNADLDRLVQSGAEHVFAAARPLRYIDYLALRQRFAEAEAMLPALAMRGDDHARSLAYASWASLLLSKGDMYGERNKAQIAVRLDPDNASALALLAGAENNLEHEEGAFDNLNATIRHAERNPRDFLDPETRDTMPVFWALFRDEEAGDFSGAIAAITGAAAKGLPYHANNHVLDSALDHDPAQARRVIAFIPESRNGKPNFDLPLAQMFISADEKDWTEAARQGARADAMMKQAGDRDWEDRRDVWPLWAESMAHAGNIAGAEALIAQTPADCDDCVRKRGRIAALAGDWIGAAHWFAIVSARSPSIPFADTDWGQMLLARGDFDAAIAKFSSAHAKGPHFADPLELWGEALIAKNRSDLALAKFAEANKYAPAWGRLHLKWGEALLYAGRRDAARAQFEAATNLTPVETSERAADLARL
ncbi:MAG TPA: hypothetical protein VMF67_07115 [Rhizomicrobium sp.]|nr:hypothetical protein [Rhizomicrobium sp.]